MNLKLTGVKQSSTSSKEERAKRAIIELGYLCNIMIDKIDELEGTSLYKHRFKQLLKNTLAEAEDISNKMYKGFATYGTVQNGEGTMHTLDVYNITDTYVSGAFNYLFSLPPSKIVKLMEYLKRVPDEELDKIGVSYRPMIQVVE